MSITNGDAQTEHAKGISFGTTIRGLIAALLAIIGFGFALMFAAVLPIAPVFKLVLGLPILLICVLYFVGVFGYMTRAARESGNDEVSFDRDHTYVNSDLRNRFRRELRRGGSKAKDKPVAVKFIVQRKLIGIVFPMMIIPFTGLLILVGMYFVPKIHIRSNPGRFKVEDPVYANKSGTPDVPAQVRDFAISIPWWAYVLVLYTCALLMYWTWAWFRSKVFAITDYFYVSANLYSNWFFWLSVEPSMVPINETGPVKYHEPFIIGGRLNYGTFMSDGPTVLDDWLNKVRYIPHVVQAVGIARRIREELSPKPIDEAKALQEAVKQGIMDAHRAIAEQSSSDPRSDDPD